MTRRPTLREAIAPLSSMTGSTDADRWYSEDVRDFVHGVMRDVLRLHHDPSIVNQLYPDCCLAYLEVVREEYGIDEDRDRDVYRTFEELAHQADVDH